MKTDAKKERDYGEAALKHVRRNQLTQLPTIKPKTPEWNAWRTYFVNHRNFQPYIMKLRESRSATGAKQGNQIMFEIAVIIAVVVLIVLAAMSAAADY